ncbi:hypothetical protein JTB14_011915 [Gonioctena quinquepunctata]|nr:hypothetical protein JTB14_011915 [Gonioctena quinquepunctata]
MIDLQCLNTIECNQGAVRAVRFNVDGSYCLTCGSDKKLKLWNPYSSLLLKTYGGHGNEVMDASSSCDSSQIVSCSSDKSVILWDVSSGQPLRRLRGHAATVTCVTYNEESTVVISGSLDNTVMCWDIKSRSQVPIQTLKEAKDCITSIQITDHEILTGSVDCSFRRYDLRNGRCDADFIGGHIQYNCPNKKFRKYFQKRHNANMSEDCQDRDDECQKFPDDAEGVAFMVNNSSSSSKYNELSRMIWYVDSGASDHLTNDIQVLEDVKELEKPIKIGVAKAGEDLEGTHVGSIRVSNNVDGRIHNYTLLDVIYVPNLRKNLLSVGKIEKKGFRVDFHKHQIFIMKDSTNLSTQVSHSSETNGSTFEEEEGTDTETEGVENVSPVTDEVNANRDRNQEKRCSSRSHQPPLWLNYHETYAPVANVNTIRMDLKALNSIYLLETKIAKPIVKLQNVKVGEQQAIYSAKIVPTKFGETVLLELKKNIVFLPQRVTNEYKLYITSLWQKNTHSYSEGPKTWENPIQQHLLKSLNPNKLFRRTLSKIDETLKLIKEKSDEKNAIKAINGRIRKCNEALKKLKWDRKLKL